MLNYNDIKWPEYDVSFLKKEKINIVVQINGKKRGLLNLVAGLSEDDLIEIIVRDQSLKKYLDDQKIKRKIYIKDKLINIII